MVQIFTYQTMALPIKSTPVLYGEASRRFNEAILRVEAGEGKVPKEEVERIKDLCHRILEKAEKTKFSKDDEGEIEW